MVRKTFIFILAGLLPVFIALSAFAYSYHSNESESTPELASQVSDYYEHEADVSDETGFACQSCWFLGVGGGLTFSTLQNNSIYIQNGSPTAPPPYNLDTFSVASPSSAGTVDFFAGYGWKRPGEFFPDISLAARYQYLTSFNITGTIDQYSLPITVNYNYTLNNSANIFTLFGKFDIVEFHSFAPYVSLDMGMACDTLENYSEQSLAGVHLPRIYGYGSNTAYNLTYGVGAGLDYFLNRRFSLSLGYEYDNLGTVSTKNGIGLYSGQSLFNSPTPNCKYSPISNSLAIFAIVSPFTNAARKRLNSPSCHCG